MEIKLSDRIWTVICFGLFTLVLNSLLIKPVLKLMDDRKAKVEKARSLERERALALEAGSERQLEAARLEAEKLETQARAELEAYRASSAGELQALSASLKEREAEAEKAIEAETASVREGLDSSMGVLVEAFTDKLMKGGGS